MCLADIPCFCFVRYSDELCLPALSAPLRVADAEQSARGVDDAACEAVQFVMGALRVSAGGVALLYGVQDCEAASVTFSLAELQRLLRHEV